MRTTLVPELQRLAEKAVAEGLREKNAPAQAALVALAPDGAVLALVGGADHRESAFNRAAALRQPGSTFKLFVYYAALKAGLDPRDGVDDAPIEIDGWSPENVGEDVDLGGLPTARGADGLRLRPPLPPCAERCALT